MGDGPQLHGRGEAQRRARLNATEHGRLRGVVDAVAGGYSPRDELGPLRPQRQFLVREADGRLVPAAGTFHRYDLAADVAESISTAGAVDLYRSFQPRLEAIYAEVGWAAESFDTRLRQAVDHLLAVDGLSGPLELEQRAVAPAAREQRQADRAGRAAVGRCDPRP